MSRCATLLWWMASAVCMLRVEVMWTIICTKHVCRGIVHTIDTEHFFGQDIVHGNIYFVSNTSLVKVLYTAISNMFWSTYCTDNTVLSVHFYMVQTMHIEHIFGWGIVHGSIDRTWWGQTHCTRPYIPYKMTVNMLFTAYIYIYWTCLRVDLLYLQYRIAYYIVGNECRKLATDWIVANCWNQKTNSFRHGGQETVLDSLPYRR